MTAYIDYARRGRNDWWRVLLTIALALVISIALVAVIAIGLMVTRLMPADVETELLTPSHPVVFFIGNGLTFAVVVAGFIAALRLVQGKRPADIVGDWRWRLFWTGVGVWTACLVVSTLADFAIHPRGFHWTAGAGAAALAVSALVGLGVQTFAEEFVFRGYLTQMLLLATRRPLPAAALSGLVFGAVHIPNGWPQCVGAMIFGVVAALIAIRTGGIAFTFGLHLVNNLFGAVIVVSGGDVFSGSPGLITQITPDLMWWDVAVGAAVLAVPAWLVLKTTPEPGPAD